MIALTSLTALAEAIDFSGYNDAELIELLASVHTRGSQRVGREWVTNTLKKSSRLKKKFIEITAIGKAI